VCCSVGKDIGWVVSEWCAEGDIWCAAVREGDRAGCLRIAS